MHVCVYMHFEICIRYYNLIFEKLGEKKTDLGFVNQVRWIYHLGGWDVRF